MHSSIFSLLAASVFARPLRLLTASVFATYVWPSLVGRHTGRLTSSLFARYCFTYLISSSSARSHAPVTVRLQQRRQDKSPEGLLREVVARS